jgi:anti-sigma factor RsiW
MSDEQLEFQISQYLDGTLAPDERSALDVRLAQDAEARELLETYRQLDVTLRNAMPLPEIRWERLAAHLSEAVSHQQVPAQTYKLPMAHLRRVVGLAAAVALAAGIFFIARNDPAPPHVAVNQLQPGGQSVVVVLGPTIPTASEAAIQRITIGAPPAVAEAAQERHTAEIIVSRPTSILIASSGRPAQDTIPTLY